MESFMDELNVKSQPGLGTTVRMRKRLIPEEMPLARNA
jgi:hypothetical protein